MYFLDFVYNDDGAGISLPRDSDSLRSLFSVRFGWRGLLRCQALTTGKQSRKWTTNRHTYIRLAYVGTSTRTETYSLLYTCIHNYRRLYHKAQRQPYEFTAIVTYTFVHKYEIRQLHWTDEVGKH